MYISKVSVKNFRLLEDVKITLTDKSTVIVGRNNSGKTSLTEIFKRIMGVNSLPRFAFEDFSMSTHEKFWNALKNKIEGKNFDIIRSLLPCIEVEIRVTYDCNLEDYGGLGYLIVDMDPDSREVVVKMKYQLKGGSIESFFAGISSEFGKDEKRNKFVFCKLLKERIPVYYSADLFVVDPGDEVNVKPIEWNLFRQIIGANFINAQRGLDDVTSKEQNIIGKTLERLFKNAESANASKTDQDIANELREAVKHIQDNIDDGFKKQLQSLLPAFSIFGYPGLSDPNVCTETVLDVESILSGHTKIYYTGENGVNLPESYNGLGVRNLIYILIRMFEFYKGYLSSEQPPSLYLIFIEEPEAHLHPQMQEVFISKINSISEEFSRKFNNGKVLPIQFVITTHSSYIANKADFSSIRYFTAIHGAETKMRSTIVKDISVGISDINEQEFFHQYMTLTRCDLFFCDKAVLIEGTTERILLPVMIKQIDDVSEKDAVKLSSQYISTMEVGGAYAHKFVALLNFLEIKSLIITDIDSVSKDEAKGNAACPVSFGTGTSNGCLKNWFDDKITPPLLFEKNDDDKVKGNIRIAYQIPEDANLPCGRSFEAAFMLANRHKFELTGIDESKLEKIVWEKSSSISKKSEFALNYAIKDTKWIVPKYISESLKWLA